MKAKIIGLIFLILMVACSSKTLKCDFKLNHDYIKTNCTLFNGLEVEKLRNVTVAENGIPKNYDIEFKASYGGTGEAFDLAMDSKLNIIKFKEPIKGYNWIIHGKDIVSSIMPFNFEPNNWYSIGDLYENGAPSVVLFVYVEDDGRLIVHRMDAATNW